MALPPLPKLTEVRTEFSGPVNLRAYNRGGSYVPDSGSNSNIATDPNSLRLSQFAGASAIVAPTLTPSPNPGYAFSQGDTASQQVGVTINLNPSGGNGTYSYSVAFVSSTNGTSPTYSLNTSLNTIGLFLTISATVGQTKLGQVVYDVTVTSNSLTSSAYRITANLEYERYDPNCVVVTSIIVEERGLISAGLVEVEHSLLVTDPFLEKDNTDVASVNSAHSAFVACVRIRTKSGAWLDVSKTALIPVDDGTYVRAPYLVGRRIPIANLHQIQQSSSEFSWEEVDRILNIGVQEVRHIYLKHRAFWASSDGKSFILHHNAKAIV